jgi:PadR family transcriptional regulator, regulatory protein AphA
MSILYYRSSKMDLTPTAAIVLGLLSFGDATSYDLKTRVAASIGNFWSIPHSALYAEPERLLEAGYVTERREEGGRRRRVFSLTAAGRAALAAWRAEPAAGLPELRNPALLKLFFGADPAAVAASQLDLHRAKLAHYETIKALDDGKGARGPFLALEAGLRHQREWIAYWEALAG